MRYAALDCTGFSADLLTEALDFVGIRFPRGDASVQSSTANYYHEEKLVIGCLVALPNVFRALHTIMASLKDSREACHDGEVCRTGLEGR